MLIDSILTEACQNLSRLKDNLTVFLLKTDTSKNKAVKTQDFDIRLFYRILQAGDHYKNKNLINSVTHFHVF